MAEDWTAVAVDVDAGLREVGTVATIHQPGSDGTYDPLTDTTSGASAPATHTAYGVEGEPYSSFSIASGVVAAGDVRFLLSPLKVDGSVMPKPVPDSWTLTLGGVVHAIKAVDTTSPAGLGVLYELRLRIGG